MLFNWPPPQGSHYSEGRTLFTCSRGIPNSAFSRLCAALRMPIASFSSSSNGVLRGWLQQVLVKQSAKQLCGLNVLQFDCRTSEMAHLGLLLNWLWSQKLKCSAFHVCSCISFQQTCNWTNVLEQGRPSSRICSNMQPQQDNVSTI